MLVRTAVIRIKVDPAGKLSASALAERTDELARRAAEQGMSLVSPKVEPDLQLLAEGEDSQALLETAARLCAEVYGTEPAPGVVTYISRGTDEDALGVLAGFGLTGEVTREDGDEGWDIVTVRLSRADLERVPESRIHTALEASLNCEVRIVT